ncbi:MAG TPA: molybdenum cofactor synthesis domain-containing protein [Candidatus Limnocylindria bacterium]|nr:molybdenum cofactor synthesis domain-containing protein [Candidatus Limnocylindria bacterium]
MNSCFVLTISDGVAAGSRQDESGRLLAERLAAFGFGVERGAVPDESEAVAAAVRDAVARGHRLVVTSGGTGLGPRDRTPEALRPLLDLEIPGFGEAMRAAGRASTPLVDLSRSFAGAIGSALVIAVPGSPGGALESLGAVQPLLEHALQTLIGDTQHR